jgi:chemotaxis protein MotB
MKATTTVYMLTIALGLTAVSCVPSRMYDDLNTNKLKCDEENSRLKSEALQNATRKEEMERTIKDLQREVNYLRTDTTTMGTANRRITNLFNELTASYEKLGANNEKLLASNQSETRKVMLQLQLTQEELQRKEDSLNVREKKLAEANEELKLREAKVLELKRILNSKDSAVTALKESVTKALLGYNNNGLTIEQKNGKVYVSLEEQLLFASGSIVVDKRGAEALKNLSQVLEKNTDINVLIEGHTDNVPIKGGTMKDNWDLSVLRATSVVRILSQNKGVAPVRLTAAGRGEYFPVDAANTSEARKKNRRIDVILTPKLDEIFHVLESH